MKNSKEIKVIYRIFISHAWSYNETYWSIKEMLSTASENYYGFQYVDYSIPDHNPILDPKGLLLTAPRSLAQVIRTRIEQSSVVIIPARMFISYSDWVQREIAYARELRKRVIAVRSRQTLRTPAQLEYLADITIDANYRSLYNAIVG